MNALQTTFKVIDPDTQTIYEVGGGTGPAGGGFKDQSTASIVISGTLDLNTTYDVHNLYNDYKTSDQPDWNDVDNLTIDLSIQQTGVARLAYNDTKIRLIKFTTSSIGGTSLYLNSLKQSEYLYVLKYGGIVNMFAYNETISDPLNIEQSIDDPYHKAYLTDDQSLSIGAFSFNAPIGTSINFSVDFIVEIDEAIRWRYDYIADVSFISNGNSEPQTFSINLRSPSFLNQYADNPTSLQWNFSWGQNETYSFYWNNKDTKKNIYYRISLMSEESSRYITYLDGQTISPTISYERVFPRFDKEYYDVVYEGEERLSLGFNTNQTIIKVDTPADVGSTGPWRVIGEHGLIIEATPGTLSVTNPPNPPVEYITGGAYADVYDPIRGIPLNNDTIYRIDNIENLRSDPSGRTLTKWNSEYNADSTGSLNDLLTYDKQSLTKALNETYNHAHHDLDITDDEITHQIGGIASWRLSWQIPEYTNNVTITGNYMEVHKDPDKQYEYGALIVQGGYVTYSFFNEDTGAGIRTETIIDGSTGSVNIHRFIPIPYNRRLDIVNVTGSWDSLWPIRAYELWNVSSLYGVIGDYRELYNNRDTLVDAINDLQRSAETQFIEINGPGPGDYILTGTNIGKLFISLTGADPTGTSFLNLNNKTPGRPILLDIGVLNSYGGPPSKRLLLQWLDDGGAARTAQIPQTGLLYSGGGRWSGTFLSSANGSSFNIIWIRDDNQQLLLGSMASGENQVVTGSKTFQGVQTFTGQAAFTNSPNSVTAPSKTVLGTSATQWATEASVTNAIAGIGSSVQVIAHQAGLHPTGQTDLDASISGNVVTEYFLWHYHSGAWIKTTGTYNATVDATQYSIQIDYDQPLSFLGKAQTATPTELDQTSVISETHSVAFLYPIPGTCRYTGTTAIDQTTITMADVDIQTFNNSAKADGSLVYGNGLLFRLGTLNAGIWEVVYVSGTLAPANGSNLGTQALIGTYNATGNRITSGWESISYSKVRP